MRGGEGDKKRWPEGKEKGAFLKNGRGIEIEKEKAFKKKYENEKGVL